MTLSELRTAVKNEFDQQGTLGAFTDDQIDDFINEAYWDFCIMTKSNVSSGTQVLAALDAVVTFPYDFIETRQVRYSYNLQLYPKPERQMDYDALNWRYRCGTPENYVWYNWNTARLAPRPTAAGTVTFRYNSIPDVMTAGTEIPSIPVSYHQALIDFAAAQCFLIVRDYENGARKWKSYLELRKQAMKTTQEDHLTEDTLVSQRPVTVFNWPLWDHRFRIRK